MTEKDFRKLVTDLEMPRALKENINQVVEIINQKLTEDLKYASLENITKIGSLARSTMLNDENNVDVLLTIKYESDKTFKLVNQLVINAIVNTAKAIIKATVAFFILPSLVLPLFFS